MVLHFVFVFFKKSIVQESVQHAHSNFLVAAKFDCVLHFVYFFFFPLVEQWFFNQQQQLNEKSHKTKAIMVRWILDITLLGLLYAM